MSYDKYIYGRDFEKSQKKPKTEITFSKEEVEHAKESSYQAGWDDAQREYREVIDSKMMHALTGIQEHLVKFIDVEAEKRKQVQKDAAQLAKTIAMKICVTEAEQNAIDRVLMCMNQVTKSLIEHPKVTVNVSPDIASSLPGKIHEMVQNHHIEVVVDESLQKTDCRFSWAEGGAESILEKTLDEIDEIIDKLPPSKAETVNKK